MATNYDLIANGFLQRRVVPFLGAGVNLVGRPEGSVWNGDERPFLPNSAELADFLAQRHGYKGRDEGDLVRVSQYVDLTAGSGPLYEDLHGVFDGDYPPTPLHAFFARLPGRLRRAGETASLGRHRRLVIVTSNYDDLLERAFEDAGEPYHLLTYVALGPDSGRFRHTPPGAPQGVVVRSGNDYGGISGRGDTSVIVKIHGAIDRRDEEGDSFVITEDHYIDYAAKPDVRQLLPVAVASRLSRCHFLFLGYSLRDWNLRVTLYRIWKERARKYNSWAIVKAPEGADFDFELDQRFWGEQGVELVDSPLEAFLPELEASLGTNTAPGG